MTEIEAINSIIKKIHLHGEKHSLRLFAENTTLKRHRLSRILKSEITPTLEELYYILRELGEKEKYQEYCKALHPEISDHLSSGFRDNPVNVQFADANYDAHLQNEEYDKLMTVCSFGKGCKLEELEDKFTRSCFKHLKTLIERGIIVENNGYFFCDLKRKQASPTTQLKRIANATKHYDESKIGTQSNAYFYRPFETDEATLRKIHHHLADFLDKVEDLVRESKHNDKPKEKNFLGLVMDDFNEPEIKF